MQQGKIDIFLGKNSLLQKIARKIILSSLVSITIH